MDWRVKSWGGELISFSRLFRQNLPDIIEPTEQIQHNYGFRYNLLHLLTILQLYIILSLPTWQDFWAYQDHSHEALPNNMQ
jgi:hypothetical protein